MPRLKQGEELRGWENCLGVVLSLAGRSGGFWKSKWKGERYEVQEQEC